MPRPGQPLPLFGFFRRLLGQDRAFRQAIATLIGRTPDNIRLYQLAFTHSSLVRQQGEQARHQSNERLEFLGDAVLGTVVAEYLFQKYPYEQEGFLTEMRSRIVNRESLNGLALKIGLDKLIQLDATQGRSTRSRSVNGNALEALVGAVYLDQGYKAARKFVLSRLIKPFVDVKAMTQTTTNFKSKLIEWAQRHGKAIRYDLQGEARPGGVMEFTASVVLEDEVVATGMGLSKKQAEQLAAERALTALGV
ncbi:ribonuclease III [Hymenobacter lutimineralis]|uniref:Ribonuclease 3 n=1 Tax=Hymenobacter lutimineralis TaxID=2606448 RepID=A0A5D6UR64_9BACT|nr:MULTISPECIES: ribonuclease III [Hymenobacter]QIX62438.1 ribonuclease III [Hymenobacter sp. BT18]TYZ05933.1 ribonuclease III [Hymenobacter lutimineralis]